jgi:hypothetical protein
MLKDLTIVAVDSLNYEATAMALDKTREIFPDAKVITFSDKNFYPDSTFYQTSKFDAKEHSRICLHEVGDRLETNYVMFIQYDGFPTNKDCWSDEFLKYDFIGAPVRMDTDSFVVNYDNFFVGNGGFSLRTKRLMMLTKNIEQQFVDGDDSFWLEDMLICHKNRSWLEDMGITFAPLELAQQFSKGETLGLENTLGFHMHNLVPEYCGKEYTLKWLDAIDDSVILKKNLYCIPYFLWKWNELDYLRSFMLRAQSLNEGWKDRCWEECRWRVHIIYPHEELFEIQKMITVYGYTGP